MKHSSLFILLFITSCLMAQTSQTYTDTKGRTQLTGPFELAELQTNPNFSPWFQENYQALDWVYGKNAWAKNLADVTAHIYLGTWCGDSQYLVPRFVKLWDELGLKREQLHFVAVYGSDVEGKYKLSAHGEEKGEYIHRLPTIILNRNEKELGRIVETPTLDLNADVAQMALGNDLTHNFSGATQLMQWLDNQTIAELKAHQAESLTSLKEITKTEGELNALARVYWLTNRTDKALLTLEWNTHLFSDSPKVYEAYATVLAMVGETEQAIKNYEQVLQLEPFNTDARQALQTLKAEK